MRRQLRWYGASPLHLLALLACFGLAGYAAARLIPSRPLGVAAWFLGAVIGHDLLLMPLYSLADRSVMAAIRHRDPQLPVTPWINYVRLPAALSGLLMLVWFPLILRLPSPYHASTALSADPYVWHWLAVTGALFLLSAVAFALRLRGRPRAVRPPHRPATPPAERPVAPLPQRPVAPLPQRPVAPLPQRPVAPLPERRPAPAGLDGRDSGHDTGKPAPAEGKPGPDPGESSPGPPQRPAEEPGSPGPVGDRPGGGH